MLIVGETGGATAKTVFIGFGIAFLYKFLCSGLRLWKEVASRALDWFLGATPALEADPAPAGRGLHHWHEDRLRDGGRRHFAGLRARARHPFLRRRAHQSALSGHGRHLFDGCRNDLESLRSLYRRGAVATGGIISLCRALPLIIASIGSGLRDVRGAMRSGGGVRRTDRDLPLATVFFGSLLLVVAIWLFLELDPQTAGQQSWAAMFDISRVLVNLAAAALIVVFGFLFVTVSSRLTGEIGSSSNPISGMTIATLLLTCLIFLLLGWTTAPYRLLALSVAAVVCIAASNGGTTSQDLKTGFLVGATPKWQQLAIVVGSVSSAVVIGAVLMAMNQSSTVYSTKNLPQLKQPLDMKALQAAGQWSNAPNSDTLYYVWHATEGNPQGVPPAKYLVDDQGKIRYLVDPGISGKLSRQDDGSEVRKFNPPQAELFALITNGILSQKLPWVLVLLGVAIAAVVELCGVSSLAFAVGVYLPLSTSAPIFVGGLVRYAVERFARKPEIVRPRTWNRR